MLKVMMPKVALRRRFASMLVVAMLFMQLATAAYACGMAFPAQGWEDVAAAHPCAEMGMDEAGLDPANPGLCLQHCQYGTTQAGDSGQAQQLPLAPSLVIAVLRPTDSPAAPAAARAQAVLASERAPPPHAILHCCHRL